MAKSSFQGLNLIRKDNQKNVISILKNCGSSSCTQLSSALSLSSVAMYNIMDDLRKKNIVKAMSDSNASIGRKPSLYTLNDLFGLFAAVDFSYAKIRFVFFDINGKRVFSHETEERGLLSVDDVYETIEEIKSALKNNNPHDLRLKCISIATPGRINRSTGYFWKAAKFKDCEHINLHKIFSESFNCPVEVKNDMYAALIGHKGTEPFSSARSALYFHVGNAAGAALVINGEIFEGENGYAGEFGSVTDYSDRTIITQISLGSMVMQYIKSTLESGSRDKLSLLGNIVDFTVENFVDKYLGNDETALNIADRSARIFAVTISNLVVMLDISTVIINGNLALLGDKYLKTLNEYVNNNEFSKKTICYFSPLREDATLLGLAEISVQSGIYAALDQPAEV